MDNKNQQSSPETQHRPTVDELFKKVVELEPKVITDIVPDNAAEEKQRFLNGETRNPNNHYPKLESNPYEQNIAQIAEYGREFAVHPELNPKYKNAYLDFTERYMKAGRLLEVARDFKQAEGEERDRLAAEYGQLNAELYGEPEESVYRSLLSEKVARIEKKELTGKALEIKAELMDLLGDVSTDEQQERFRPSEETMEWMHGVVESLYGNMLAHVPADVETFDAEAAKAVFDAILHEEFGEIATDWHIDIEDAQSVNVKATEKRIVIPSGREISQDAIRGLVVHEIGIHMFRAVQGANTDLNPMETGLAGYLDTEEGLGVVMQQALKSQYREAGVDHYITIGLAHFEQKDFRDTFEIKWRLNVLASLKPGVELTDEAIQKSKNAAYGATMRTYRATDELPLYKDLSYFNGARDIWRHLESIRGDDIKFMFVLLGKLDPTNPQHERIAYETHTDYHDNVPEPDADTAPELETA